MNSDEKLKQQLAAWNVEMEVPPHFQADVWARIAARESSRRPFWDQFREWVAAEFYKPLPAVAVVTLALLLSMGTAYFQAQDSNARNGKQMEALYMQTINPLAHPGGHS